MVQTRLSKTTNQLESVPLGHGHALLIIALGVLTPLLLMFAVKRIRATPDRVTKTSSVQNKLPPKASLEQKNNNKSKKQPPKKTPKKIASSEQPTKPLRDNRTARIAPKVPAQYTITYPEVIQKKVDYASKVSIHHKKTIRTWMQRHSVLPTTVSNFRVMNTLATLRVYYAAHANDFGENGVIEITNIGKTLYNASDQDDIGQQKWTDAEYQVASIVKKITRPDKLYLLYLIYFFNHHGQPVLEQLETRFETLLTCLKDNKIPFLTKKYFEQAAAWSSRGRSYLISQTNKRLGITMKKQYDVINSLLLLCCVYRLRGLNLKLEDVVITKAESRARNAARKKEREILSKISDLKKILHDQQKRLEYTGKLQEFYANIKDISGYKMRIMNILYPFVTLHGLKLDAYIKAEKKHKKKFLALLTGY